VLVLAALHGLYPAAYTHGEVAWYTARAGLEAQWIEHAEIDDGRIAGQRVFIVAAADWATQFALAFARHHGGHPLPRSVHVLSGAFADAHLLTRTGPRELDIAVAHRPTLGILGSVYRPADAPFRGGERIALDAFELIVLRAEQGQPRRWRVRFPEPLEDSGYLFLQSTPRGLRRLPLPKVGARILLPEAAPPRPLPHVNAPVNSPPRLRTPSAQLRL
jgi:hypothetical protein